MMATVNITVQSLLNTAVYDPYSVDDTDTIGTFKTTIQTITNVDPAWYVLYFNGEVLNDANTLASYSITENSVLRSANRIADLATRQNRQEAKLALAELDRIYSGESRTTLDITELPSVYIGNTSVPNSHPTGLIEGRPWV
jgi:hypothetical protein